MLHGPPNWAALVVTSYGSWWSTSDLGLTWWASADRCRVRQLDGSKGRGVPLLPLVLKWGLLVSSRGMILRLLVVHLYILWSLDRDSVGSLFVFLKIIISYYMTLYVQYAIRKWKLAKNESANLNKSQKIMSDNTKYWVVTFLIHLHMKLDLANPTG